MVEIQMKLNKERNKVNTEPTQAQIEAENYAMGHIWINGFEITIENPKGSYRKGVDRNGHEWKTLMKNDYGYFTSTVGKDGDAIDVFIGNNFHSPRIFAIDQKIAGKFDETKVMFCFSNAEQAKKAYLSNYDKNWKGFWKITEVDIVTFKKWLYDGHRQYKPFFQYKEIKDNKQKITIKESELKSLINEVICEGINKIIIKDL
jgi:inorganic pyrophosphatase